jgi:hypothetical protein
MEQMMTHPPAPGNAGMDCHKIGSLSVRRDLGICQRRGGNLFCRATPMIGNLLESELMSLIERRLSNFPVLSGKQRHACALMGCCYFAPVNSLRVKTQMPRPCARIIGRAPACCVTPP